ncbi:MAG: LysR family transcriptional regulator [Roseivirga sp.]|nr:LysR family transcriptional regulator [Roseivirga sp.]
MEIRHLKYLMAVGQELHFGKAAEKLFITQPALSRQIQQLEEELGVKLLERDKRNVALTTAGAYLLDEAEYIINHLNQVIESTRRKAKGEEGEVRIGFVGSAMQDVIPDLLVRLNQQYPKLHTSLDELSNKEQLSALIHDRLDIGFVRMERVPTDYGQKVVFEDSFSLVLPADHQITKDSFESLIQLKAEQFILFSHEYSQEYYENIMSIFADHGFEPNVSHRSVHANTIFRLVEKHLGVAIVPTALASGVSLGVQFIPLASLPQRTRLTAVWDERNRNAALKKLIALL